MTENILIALAACVAAGSVLLLVVRESGRIQRLRESAAPARPGGTPSPLRLVLAGIFGGAVCAHLVSLAALTATGPGVVNALAVAVLGATVGALLALFVSHWWLQGLPMPRLARAVGWAVAACLAAGTVAAVAAGQEPGLFATAAAFVIALRLTAVHEWRAHAAEAVA